MDYSYTVKVLNGKRKKPVTKQIHHLNSSIVEMRRRIQRQIKDELETASEFDIGYYEGRHSSKRWILEEQDLIQMYSKHKGNEIHLWCEIIKPVENEPPSQKRKKDVSS